MTIRQWVHMAWNGYIIGNMTEAGSQLLVDITNEVIHSIDASDGMVQVRFRLAKSSLTKSSTDRLFADDCS